MPDEHTSTRVRRAVDAIWNRGELDHADGLFAPDYINHGGLIPDLVRGPEAVKFSAALFRAAYPSLEVTVKTLVTHGESLTLHWCALTTHATDRDGAVPAVAVLSGKTSGRVKFGKIVETWTAWETPRQLVDTPKGAR